MDISFIYGNDKFNYRVGAIILSDGKLLAMRDERSPYYYLPGGRVKIGETAEDAIIRELREELDINAKIVRPLWLNQAFFTEDVDHLHYHEICLYFLVDLLPTDLSDTRDCFTRHDGQHTHAFEWLPLEQLRHEYFYPIFLKTEIFHLPEHLTLRTEYES